MKTWKKLKALWRILDRYDGATFSTSRSLSFGAVQNAHLDLNKASRTELVRKVRELEKNNGIVNKCADLSEQFVAGPGGMPVVAASSDAKWNSNAQAWWDQWCGMCDVQSLQSFGTIQGLLARMVEIDGEAFILKTQGDTGNPRIQILEGHNIETPASRAKDEGKIPGIIDGVEVNEVGRPTAYYLIDGTPNGKRIDAAAVIHYFEPSRPGQYRGLTPWHAVINDLIDLDDLQTLEMRAAKDAAEVSNVLTSENGEVNIDDLRRELRGVTTQDSSGTAKTENRAEFVRDAIGGRTLALRIGEKLEQFRSDRPNVATQDYWDYLVGKVCAGRGISKLLSFPYGKFQGTLVRAELDVAAGFFRCRSSVLQDVIRQIWIYVMGTAIRRDPSLSNAPKDWVKVSIVPPRAPNVDVGYNSAAMIAEWKAGVRTLASICQPLGLDWKEVIRQRAAEALEIRRVAKDAGLEPEDIANPTEKTPVEEPQPHDTNELVQS